MDQPKTTDEYSLIVKQFQKQPALLHLIYGHSGVFTAGLTIASAAGQPVAVIDGAVRFNSYKLSKIASYLGIPAKTLLQRSYVTRSFTSFQTEAAITTKLPGFLASHQCRIVVIMGLLDTYYDEQVKADECRQSLRRVMHTLRRLARKNIHILITDVEVTNPSPGKENLLRLVKRAVDNIMVMEMRNDGFHFTEERKELPWEETTTHSRLS